MELPSELDKGPDDTAVDLSSNSFEVRPCCRFFEVDLSSNPFEVRPKGAQVFVLRARGEGLVLRAAAQTRDWLVTLAVADLLQGLTAALQYVA